MAIIGSPRALLRELYQPMYDTLRIPSPNPTYREDLFVDHRKFLDGSMKTREHTNMWLDSQLGHPLEAEWSWLRVMFCRWPDLDRAQEFCANTVVELFTGYNVPVLGPVPLCGFDPIVPAVTEIPASDPADQTHLIVLGMMRRQLDKKEMKFWPWLQLPFAKKLHVHSGEQFRVVVSSPTRPMPQGIRAIVMLGPTLFAPQ